MKALLERLLNKQDLLPDQAASLAQAMCEGRLSEAVVAAMLVALRAKGESADEIAAFARVLRTWARRPQLPPGTGPLVDIVGTGGDGSGSLNISTAAALVAAGAGVQVAKHGNRAVSGRCGAADVLEAMGVPLAMEDRALAECLSAARFIFLFAPHYHPALAGLAPVRRTLGVRTIFNQLGPLINPAMPSHAVLGACSVEAARRMAMVARLLGMQRCFVVSSANGWDEATSVCPFTVVESHADRGELREFARSASDYELERAQESQLAGGDAAFNAGALREMLKGAPSALRDAASITASLAIEVTGRAASPMESFRLATAAIDSGRAARVLQRAAEAGRSPAETVA